MAENEDLQAKRERIEKLDEQILEANQRRVANEVSADDKRLSDLLDAEIAERERVLAQAKELATKSAVSDNASAVLDPAKEARREQAEALKAAQKEGK